MEEAVDAWDPNLASQSPVEAHRVVVAAAAADRVDPIAVEEEGHGEVTSLDKAEGVGILSYHPP